MVQHFIMGVDKRRVLRRTKKNQNVVLVYNVCTTLRCLNSCCMLYESKIFFLYSQFNQNMAAISSSIFSFNSSTASNRLSAI